MYNCCRTERGYWMSPRCRLIFYLHMHQPYYKNLRTGEYLLPWARLHALRNYADIPVLQERYPGVTLTYNLVPSLVEQILDYAAGAEDGFESVSRIPADSLEEQDLRFILSNFFQLHREGQIECVPRFRELLALKGDQSRDVDAKTLKRFKPEDIRDLQVLFNLAWSGWLLRAQPEVAVLLDKGRGFSEEEKNSLLDAQRRFLGTVLEPYVRLQEAGACEVSTTAYYHPILPLLCNLESSREAVPDLPLPSVPFRHPEDAAAQISAGVESYTRLFGKAPLGIWPSEGSVSNEACELIAANGIRWAATDRTVLANALGSNAWKLPAEELYTPHVLNTPAGDLTLFFRDTGLSDLPAFTYQTWDAGRAVDDFIGKIRAIADGSGANGIPLISVILDGENAWAAYPDNGRQFFETFFARLQTEEWIETVTPAQVLEDGEVEKPALPGLVAGSWIYGTLTTWIGHPEKNRGWEVLAEARDTLKEAESDPPEGADLGLARKELMIAEGSDWFWWYGDDHSTAFAAEFDTLFREHVTNIYIALGLEPPDSLLEPIKKLAGDLEITPPLRTLTPKLDGRETSYTEWINAGNYSALGGAGMQHQTSSAIGRLWFGYDKECFYLRADCRQPLRIRPLDGKLLRIQISDPIDAEITYLFGSAEPPKLKLEGKDEEVELDYGCDTVLELALPFSFLGENRNISFAISVEEDGNELERHPRGRLIELNIEAENLDAESWIV